MPVLVFIFNVTRWELIRNFPTWVSDTPGTRKKWFCSLFLLFCFFHPSFHPPSPWQPPVYSLNLRFCFVVAVVCLFVSSLLFICFVYSVPLMSEIIWYLSLFIKKKRCLPISAPEKDSSVLQHSPENFSGVHLSSSSGALSVWYVNS